MHRKQTQIQFLFFLCTLQSDIMAVHIRSHYSDYQLIFTADSRSELVNLTCRDSLTADELNVHEVSFWINRSSELSPQDLRQRTDVDYIQVAGCCSIVLKLHRHLEGQYTCGKEYTDGTLQESPPLTLICKKLHYCSVCDCIRYKVHAWEFKNF